MTLTELKQRIFGLPYIYAEFDTDRVGDVCATIAQVNGSPVVQIDLGDTEVEQYTRDTMRYMVHAANALPDVIIALQSCQEFLQAWATDPPRKKHERLCAFADEAAWLKDEIRKVENCIQ